MLTDLDIATWTAALYETVPVGFAHVEIPKTDDGICWGLVQTPDEDLVIFRGSTTAQDWERDAAGEALWWARAWSALGLVSAGFWAGMEDAFAAIKPLRRTGKPLVVGGHSLGAARALLYMAMVTSLGGNVRGAVFGPPRPAVDTLGTVLKGCSIKAYRNGDANGIDIVPDVPTAPPFSQPIALTAVSAAPLPGDASVFRYHHLTLYVQALGGPTATAAARAAVLEALPA